MTTRHWKLIQGFALAALLPLCAACNGEDDGLPQDADKQPVQVNITRATMDGGGNWTWANGDQVGLSINGATHTLTYSNGSWAPAITGVDFPATVQAWYPASASMDKFNIPHNGVEYELGAGSGDWIEGTNDQSTSNKLAAIDYMTTETIISNVSLDLTLRHRMCLVTVNIVSYEGFGSASPTIADVRIYSYTPIEKEGNEYDRSDNCKNIDVNPYVETNLNGSKRYKAIIAPGYYDGLDGSSLPFITMKVNGTTVSATYSSKLLSGNAYTFNLTVKNPAATTRSAGTPECELELVEVHDMNEE